MEIGIGLSNTIPGATGAQLLEWARRADRAGFSSLATIGAVSYPGYEELTLLAAAGAVTESVGLMPNVLIAPARSGRAGQAGGHRRPAEQRVPAWPR